MILLANDTYTPQIEHQLVSILHVFLWLQMLNICLLGSPRGRAHVDFLTSCDEPPNRVTCRYGGCHSCLVHTHAENMEYSTAARFHDSITQFKTYDDYLDSKVTPMDVFYLKVSETGTNYCI